MPARVFRRIINSLTTVSKTALLALFLFVATLGTAMPVLAGPVPDNAALQLAYGNYLNLFLPQSGLSKPSAGFLIKDVTNNNITGLKLDLSFNLNPTIAPSIEETWKYIDDQNGFTTPPDEDTFLIRICFSQNKSQCFLQKVPYHDVPNGFPYAVISQKDANEKYADKGSLQNFSVLGDINATTGGIRTTRHTYTRTIADGKNEGSIGTYDGRLKLNGSTVEATLWYCAANVNKETGQSAYQGNGNDDTIATFGSLCGGDSYFRIGSPLLLDIPAAEDTAAIASNVNTQATTGSSASTVSEDNLPTCEINISGDSKIVGCLARIVYYGLYWPLAWVAGLFGSLFDFFIGYSVSDESYRYAFAVNGWKLVRDIANVMFIVIMVYVGFAAVFSFGGGAASTMRKVIPILIINALIINFSLFATRTVIDISNVTARVFYSRMVVCSGECKYKEGSSTPENIKRGLGGHWPLSEKIVGAFDPQRMFGTITLNSKELQTQEGASNDPLINSTTVGKEINANQQKGFKQDSGEYAGYYALVSIIAAAIMLGIAAMFFNVTFMFLGRVIGLYMAMIFSPFAFLTRGGMPLFKIDGYTWDSWLKDLFNYAALAPVFIFFLYIVYSFLNTDIVKQIGVQDTTGGFFGTVLSIVIPMLFIYFLISKGVKIAQMYSGKFGNMVQGFVSNTVGGVGGVIGGGVGLAAGAGALLGTRYGSRIGKAIGESKIGSWAASNADNSKAARFFNNTLSKTQTGSWDFRNTKLNGALTTSIGKASGGEVKLTDKVSGLLSLDSKRFEGGYKGMQKKRQEEIGKNIKNRIQYDHLSDAQTKILWEQRQNKKAEESALKNFAEKKSAAYKTAVDDVRATETDLKTKKKVLGDKEKDLLLRKSTLTQTEVEKLQKEIETAKEEFHSTKKTAGEAKKKAAEELQKVRATDYKNDAAYASARDEAQKKKTEEDQKAFGKVENVGEYNNAMRREYAQNLRDNSLWMKDGKPRGVGVGFGAGAGAGTFGSILAGAGATLGATVAGAVGVALEERIAFEQEALDAATKSFVKDYGKKKGKDSREEQLAKRVKELGDLIDDTVVLKSKKTKDDVKAMDVSEKRTHFEEHVANTEAEFDAVNAEFKKAEQDFNAGKITRDQFKDVSKKRKSAGDEFNKAKNAWENKEKAEADLEKEKEKNKEK